jgi:hypothetical protein
MREPTLECKAERVNAAVLNAAEPFSQTTLPRQTLGLRTGCEPRLCAQAATGADTFGRLQLAATGGLEASAAQ